METQWFIQWELGKIQHFMAKVPDLTMAVNYYSAQNSTKGCNIIIAENNWDARDRTGTTLKSKNVFHCPVNTVCMWKSKSLLSEQTRTWWKVRRAPADCRHWLLSCLWWSSHSADSPFFASEFTMAGSPAWSQRAPLLSQFITQWIDCLLFNPCYSPSRVKSALLPLALEGVAAVDVNFS